MSVNSTGVPLFAGIEPLDDMFMATMEEMDKLVSDEVTIAHPFWEYLQRHKLIEYRDSIGTHVPVKLMTKQNTTSQWYTAYADAKNIPQDVLAEAKFAYGQLGGTQMYNREELTKNAGKEQLIDLVEAKKDQLIVTLNSDFASALLGTQDADGEQPLGIGRIMDPTLAIGGIDPTLAGNEYWVPNNTEKTPGVPFALATEHRDGMRKMYRETSLSAGGKKLGDNNHTGLGNKPDVILCGEDLYDAQQSWAEGKLRIGLDELKDSNGWGDYEMFTALGTTMIYEPNLPAKTGWALNLNKSIKVRIHRGTNFQFTPWQMMSGKMETKKRNCLLYVAIYCRSRRANSVITFS